LRSAQKSVAECDAQLYADVPSKHEIPVDMQSTFLQRKKMILVIFGNRHLQTDPTRVRDFSDMQHLKFNQAEHSPAPSHLR